MSTGVISSVVSCGSLILACLPLVWADDGDSTGPTHALRSVWTALGWFALLSSGRFPFHMRPGSYFLRCEASRVFGVFMGLSSVVWVTLRYDEDIGPWILYSVFCWWVVSTVIWIVLQCKRTRHARYYLLLTLTVAILISMPAYTKGQMDGSEVTAGIPVYISFAAFLVSFFFPEEHSDAGDGQHRYARNGRYALRSPASW